MNARKARQRAERAEIRRLLRELRELSAVWWTPRERHVAVVGGPSCDSCGAQGLDVRSSVKEQYVQYEEGMAGFDAPVLQGNLCVACRLEDGAVPEEEF